MNSSAPEENKLGEITPRDIFFPYFSPILTFTTKAWDECEFSPPKPIFPSRFHQWSDFFFSSPARFSSRNWHGHRSRPFVIKAVRTPICILYILAYVQIEVGLFNAFGILHSPAIGSLSDRHCRFLVIRPRKTKDKNNGSTKICWWAPTTKSNYQLNSNDIIYIYMVSLCANGV